MLVKLLKARICQEQEDHICFSFVRKVKEGQVFFFSFSEHLQSSIPELVMIAAGRPAQVKVSF